MKTSPATRSGCSAARISDSPMSHHETTDRPVDPGRVQHGQRVVGELAPRA